MYPSHCELDVMLCQGLSKCLHLLMWVNQHRHIVGVWILNPVCVGGGGFSPQMVLLIHVQAAAVVVGGLGLCGESVRALTARNTDGQRSGETESLFHTRGSDPVAKAGRSERECYL